VLVPVPCVNEIPERPPLLAESAWEVRPADEYLRVRALRVDRMRLLVHVTRLEAVLAGCMARRED
jgi:hypothetical protein